MAILNDLISAGVEESGNTITELASATHRRTRQARRSLQNAVSEGQDLAGDLFADTMATLRSAGQLVRERPVSTAAAMIIGGLLVGGLYTFLRRR